MRKEYLFLAVILLLFQGCLLSGYEGETYYREEIIIPRVNSARNDEDRFRDTERIRKEVSSCVRENMKIVG